MMNRENYKSCAYFNGHDKTCDHPERCTWTDMGSSCSGCAGCPLDCLQATGRPNKCPHGQPRGVNELGGAE